MLQYTLVFVLVLGTAGFVNSAVPFIHLYSHYSRDVGELVAPFHMYTEKDIPDLTKYELFYDGMDQNMDYQYQMMGNWILHGGVNYTSDGAYSYVSKWEYDTPGLFKSFTGNRPKSIRATGVPGEHRAQSINFYPKPSFEGTHTLVTEDIPDIDVTYLSMIVTGSSSWHIYSLPNYGGFPGCVDNNNFDLGSDRRVRSIKFFGERCPCIICD